LHIVGNNLEMILYNNLTNKVLRIIWKTQTQCVDKRWSRQRTQASKDFK